MTRTRLVPLLAVVLLGCPATRRGVGDGGAGGGSSSGVDAGGAGGGAGATDAGLDACGDARRTGLEACDDGDLAPDDGCSPTCGVEPGWFCPLPPAGQPSRCVPNCGDGRLVDMEPCDDGNLRSGDGCSVTCAVEPGYSCTGTPSTCRVTCGDGVHGGAELCDDGNTTAGDGCSARCDVEPGFVCVGTPSVCRPVCGDGIVAPTEVCDDGFTDACGSCNPECSGAGLGSTCGDGARCRETEACDDSNLTPGDGCSATCSLELDAGVVDGGVVADAGAAPDAGAPMDAGLPPDAGAVVDAGTPGSGALVFEKIANVSLTDDLKRVVWHPSGRFALLLGGTNRVIRYEPSTKALSLVQQLGTSLTDLDVAGDGSFFLVVGQTSATASRLWRIDVGANDALAAAADLGAISPGTVSAIAAEPGTNRFALVSRGTTTGINSLFLWTPAGGLSAARGYNAGGGALSLMWGAPALFAGSANVLTADGVNGADSRSWVEASNLFVGNGWQGGFGNPGQGAWQPNGTFGAFVGWSSNKLYAFDGSWHLVTLPATTGMSPQALAFRADGQRALVVGRALGSPLRATIIEYRPTAPGAFDDASWVDVSLTGFASPPWSGNSNQSLLDVAWRPGACDEGLIVGMDNGTSTAPTFGLAVRFSDSTQRACTP
ncbi:MAG: DUF4215 domain-containing protein [Myxococcota bacterium]